MPTREYLNESTYTHKMAAHDPRNPGEFGQQGAEFVDPFVAQAAVMRVGVGASAIGLVFVEMEVDEDDNPTRPDLVAVLATHFHFVQVGAEGALTGVMWPTEVPVTNLVHELARFAPGVKLMIDTEPERFVDKYKTKPRIWP